MTAIRRSALALLAVLLCLTLGPTTAQAELPTRSTAPAETGNPAEAASARPPSVVETPAAAAAAPTAAASAAVSLPDIPAAWPSKKLEIGLTDNPNGAASLHSTVPGMKFRYLYLAGGVNTGSGWATWNDNGKYVDYYADDSIAAGMTPVFIYYMLLQSKPNYGVLGEKAADLANAKNTSTMKSYWADVRLLFQHLGAYSETMVVDVEPDLWGYFQQASIDAGHADDATAVQVSVASSTDADVAAYANNVAGFARAWVHMRDKYAPNVLLSYELSHWGTYNDPIAQNLSLSEIDTLAARSVAFEQSTGAAFDLVSTDPTDRDAAFYQIIYGNSGAWWDSADYDRFNEWNSVFVRGVGLRMMLWQTPVGNTKMRAMNNTWGHYQDNHVEWWFGDGVSAHQTALLDSGVIAVFFGGGADGCTAAADAMGDGVTNPAAINGNTTLSYSADDDGGYFKHQVNAYYTAGALSLPGLTYNSSATANPQVVMVGTSTSIQTAVTAQTTTTVLVDVRLIGPSGSQVTHWSHDNVALTAGVAKNLTDGWTATATAAGAYKIAVSIEPAGGGGDLDLRDAGSLTVVGAGTYVPVSPTRLVDTRDPATPSHMTRLVSHKPQSWTVAGVAPIPAGAIAVTGNVTVTASSAGGYVTLGPTVAATPSFSTINFPRRDNLANGVTVALSSTGKLAAVFVGGSSSDYSHFIFDVTGYFVAGFGSAGFHPLPTYRAIDTRDPGSSLAGKFTAGTPRTFNAGSSVPAGAVAVTGNLTVTGQTAGGYFALGPTVTSRPAFSTINFPRGDNRANNVTVQLGAGGTLQAVYIAPAGSQSHLVFDVTGYYGPGGAAYVPISPVRDVDTRTGLGGTSGASKILATRTIQTFTLAGNVPIGAVAVSGNVTATGSTSQGYVTVARTIAVVPPPTSTVNFPKAENRANGLLMGINGVTFQAVFVGSTGTKTHFIFDLTGYFLTPPPAP